LIKGPINFNASFNKRNFLSLHEALYNFLLPFLDLFPTKKAHEFRLQVLYDFISRTFSFGFYYIRGLIFILFIDACLTDDEPLWEPIEWSLVQT